MATGIEKLWKKKRITKSDISELDFSFLKPHQIETPRQIIWHLMTGISNEILCQNNKCNNKVKWVGPSGIKFSKFTGYYQKFCSRKCCNNSDIFHEKKKKILLEKYGVEHPLQSQMIKDKTKQTCLKKYGVDNPMKNSEIKKKQEKTMIQNYRVTSPMLSEEILSLRAEKSFEKYGTNFQKQSHFSKYTRDILFSKDAFCEFMKTRTPNEAAICLEVNIYTIYNYIEQYKIIDYVKNRSSLEYTMKEFLEQNDINFVQNDRQQIKPLELDFYIEDKNLAIEMNGDYWHSDKHLLKTRGMTADEYHQMKTDKCYKKGIELIHISESEWNNNRDKMKEVVLNGSR